MINRHLIRSLSLTAICFMLVPQAFATLLYYEGFNYTPGTSIATNNGGSGWTNAWTAGSAGNLLGTNTAGSLAYTDAGNNTLQTSGGSVIVGNPVSTTATTATPNRVMNYNLSGGTGTVAGPGATTWISFLYKRLNFDLGTLPFSRQTTFSLFEGSAERVPIGSPNTTATVSNVFSVWGTGTHNVNAPFQAAAYPITSGSTYFVLLKIVTDNTLAADTAYVWVNWTNLTVEPAPVTATLVQNEVNLSAITTLRLQANNQNSSGSNAVCQFDEIRIGTTFADVTPQASTPTTPPFITSQPAHLSVIEGDMASFSVNASGTAPLSYQWYFNTNTPLSDATNATLTILNAQSNNAGTYSAIITNSAGATNSALATLTVLPPVPPAISTQPQNFTNVVGYPATFSVAATGSAPLRYQWLLNSTPLSARTNATLTFTIASTSDAGNYSVVITNNGGSVTSAVAILSVTPGWPVGLPVFPGADGAGEFASGGRGGIVYHVTKLDQNFNDTAAGTLRYGLNDGNFPSGVPRTIVFDVAGTFWLGRYGAERPDYDNGWDAQSTYSIPKNVTLAGQSAPGPVIIMGGVTKSGNSNVVLRNLTFAPGYGMRGFNEPDKVPPLVPTPGDFPDASIFDALEINGANVMLDHLTMLYGSSGTIWIRDQVDKFTMQYCTIALAQNYPQADPSNPSQYRGLAYGSDIQGGSSAKISFLNNLSAHLKGPTILNNTSGLGSYRDFRNNVTYNWLTWAAYSAPGGVQNYNNFINNYYLAGPGGDTVLGTNILTAAGQTSVFIAAGDGATRGFVSGNLKDTDMNGSLSNGLSADGDYTSLNLQPAAYEANIGVTLPAMAAVTNVLRYVGPRWWARPYDFALGNTNDISTNDIAAYLDQRLIKETATGTGKVMAWADDPFNSDPAEGWEWRAMLALRADSNTYSAPFSRPLNWDTDGDGMPDTWEIAHGLNPNVPNNNGDFDNDGYTDLEEYLNEIAAWPAPGEIVFTGTANNRYASIFNWRVSGVTVTIAGSNTVTSSLWQPSRYDTVVISNSSVIVDAVGQHAGTLRLTDNATLNATNGWLSVANKLENNADSTICVFSGGGLHVTNNFVNAGKLLLSGNATFTVGGTFTNTGTLDIMTWNRTLPAGFVNQGTILDRSLIAISSFGWNGTNFTASIHGYDKHSYQLQYCDALGSTNWHDVGAPVGGANAPISFSHPGGAASQQLYYRVAVDP